MACLILAAATWAAAFHLEAAQRIDRALVTFFLELGDGTPALNQAGRFVHRLLAPAVMAAIVAVVAGVAWLRGERLRAPAAAGAFAAAVVVSQSLQAVASTPRMHEVLYMEEVLWPSGHAAAVVAAAGSVAIAAPRWRAVAVVVAALDCVAIALIHYHFPSDVLGGAALGAAATLAAAGAARALGARVRSPPRGK